MRYQFSIAALLIATTVAAIASAMAGRLGWQGFFYGLMVCALLYRGGGCAFASLWYRRRGWISGFLFGLMLLVIGGVFAVTVLVPEIYAIDH